jgi:pre-mRNA 3'-end-processing factor FIP1
MDVDEDDDFYAPEEPAQVSSEKQQQAEHAPQTEAKQEDEGLEEGEEEDEASEGSDSVRTSIARRIDDC